MKLYGTLTSPYVRRTRLLLGSRPYEMINMDYYKKDRETLRRLNPAMKVPFLEDVDKDGKTLVIPDSRIMSRYLMEKFSMPKLTWPQENNLTIIEATNDSFILLFQAKERSGIDIDQDIQFFNNIKERINTTLPVLEEQVKQGVYDEWNYPSMCLLSTIDWTVFRNVYDLKPYPALLDYVAKQYSIPEVQQTDPRLATNTGPLRVV
jgi:glutathione S-transferase